MVFKYLAVGIISAIVDITVFEILIRGGLLYINASTLSFFCGFIVNYILHASFTFSSGLSFTKFIKFTVVVLINLGMTNIIVFVFYANFEAPLLGKIISLPLVALNGYVICKSWVFRLDAH